MTRPRGRPAQGRGVTRNDILDAAMLLLDEGGGKGLTMRSPAARLGVTPMSLYHHVVDRAGLLAALSDRVYGEVLDALAGLTDQRAEIRTLLTRYYDAVGRHPQLALAIFAEPEAFAGVSRQITDRLGSLLAAITAKHLLWRDILVDHAHGSGLALSSARGDQERTNLMRGQYREALDCLLERLVDR
ncbi:MAG: TetR/AcrR family transcriptional regulator [Massilia sp.]